MNTRTAWIVAILLAIILCGAIVSTHQTLQIHHMHEPMIGGLNVTSDDLVGYAESNAYADRSDSKAYGDIAWKIKSCSTITQAELNRAVNDAVAKTKAECRRGVIR
jgi:hypothetical protein